MICAECPLFYSPMCQRRTALNIAPKAEDDLCGIVEEIVKELRDPGRFHNFLRGISNLDMCKQEG